MRKINNCLIGDFVRVDSYTTGWYTIKLHPGTYYRRQAEFISTLKKNTGLYAELDAGDSVLIRFDNMSDVNNFYKQHYGYI